MRTEVPIELVWTASLGSMDDRLELRPRLFVRQGHRDRLEYREGNRWITLARSTASGCCNPRAIATVVLSVAIPFDAAEQRHIRNTCRSRHLDFFQMSIGGSEQLTWDHAAFKA